MRLKSLEIKGFKSFANETIINFNEDVIGVVGPNGSGKSNIVDAIRWVLGEQKSKELRLEKMSSVIFNGSKKRKASGMATVSLTFENTKNLLPTEYNTVKIGRTLYRSGESEYHLNGVPCRLKDITSLFLDTGIGSNSYAIIALGMVDDILSDKENARRRMFEQAAGISKYKKRKRETLLKLKNTTEDLDRIEDLLFEIENNLKQLEKQAKRTKRYYELKEQYKELSVELAVFKLANYKDRYKEIQGKLEQEQDAYRQLEVESRQLEAELEGEKKANIDKEQLLSERQRDLNELIGLIRNKENEKKILAQKATFIEQNQVKLAEQVKSAKVRTAQLEEDIEHYRTTLNGEKRLEAGFEEELEAAREKLDDIRSNHGNLKAELDEVLNHQQQLEKEVFELEKRKAINLNQVENLQREMTSYQEGISSRQAEIDGLANQLEELKSVIQDRQAQLEKLENEEAARQENIVETEAEIETLRKQISDVNRQLDARRNEYKLTKSMIDSLEGFPESIKFLAKQTDWAKEAPLLSDLIYVNKDYRVAIENYLEPYLNYYVVKSMEQASTAISLLTRGQKGKANFFILDAFEGHEDPITLLPGTQRAIDLIQVDEPYRRLFAHLLSNVLVTDNEELAASLDRSDMVLLSKSGRFVQRKFSISGGSVGLFEGKKIGRKKNLEVLEKQISKLEKEERTVSTKFYNVKSRLEELKGAINNDAIRTEREVLNQFSQQKVSLMTRLENFENYVRDANMRIKEAEDRINQLQQSNQHFDKELKDKTKALEEAKSRISDTDGNFRKVAEALSLASAAFNEKNIEFIRQQNKVNALQQELSFREKQKQETDEKMIADQRTIESGGFELEEIDEDVKRLDTELVDHYDQRREKEEALTSAEQDYFSVRGGIGEKEDKLRKLNRRLQEVQLLINSLKDKFNNLKLEFTSIGERLKIEFNITMEEVMQREPNEKLNPEELEPKVTRLKNRLDNYGEINPMAVEAYDEMNERYVSISTQRDDILEAKKTLLDTIKEIEDTATAQFMEAFNKAREYFIDVFRSLFTEDDKCDLILEEPDNPLESKIKIMAKPKGKRPISISQLSGGEKTLTATALLFALYLLKPAPFCIFDEVDAPLDDANIEKFNRIVRKFSQDSQFIIVTHNKATMAAVDIIYGVYMQDMGVSSVSAVDFRHLENTANLQMA